MSGLSISPGRLAGLASETLAAMTPCHASLYEITTALQNPSNCLACPQQCLLGETAENGTPHTYTQPLPAESENRSLNSHIHTASLLHVEKHVKTLHTFQLLQQLLRLLHTFNYLLYDQYLKFELLH